jgi:hypothetical protein
MLKNQWKKIINIIGLKDFPTFLRHYLNSQMKLINKSHLFKAIKKVVKSGDDVFILLEDLEDAGYIYMALGNPNDDYWKHDKELSESIDALKLFGVTQQKPLLMIAYKYLDEKKFKRLLKAIVSLSFRYNVIGRHQTNIMDKIYNRASLFVYKNKESINIYEILNILKDLYILDDDFKNSFEGKTFNTNNSTHKKQARYTLYKLEGQLPNGNKYDYSFDDGTIEHILPENLTEAWEEIFSEDEHDRNVYKIGNFSLLEKNKNRDIADFTFEEKKAVYKTSQYMLSNSFIKASEWNVNALKYRQAELAKVACGVWKVEFGN